MKLIKLIKFKIFSNNGFTILEITISMAATLLLIISATNFTSYVTNVKARSFTRQELFHNASIAMEFLISHINEAYAIRLDTQSDNTLNSIHLFVSQGVQNYHERVISFRPIAEPQNRLMFGGRYVAQVTQEVARYISNVQVIHNYYYGILYITITTEAEISNYISKIYPITLRRIIDIIGKEIR